MVDVHLPAAAAPAAAAGGLRARRVLAAGVRPDPRPAAGERAGAAGFVVATLEYRRGPGRLAATAADLDAALTALPVLLDGLGVEITTSTLRRPLGGRAPRALAGQPAAPASTGWWRSRRSATSARRSSTAWARGAAVDFLGGTPDEVPDVYDAADPASRMRDRPAADVVVVHGDRDQAVPVESSRGLRGRFAWLDFRELPGVDHFDVIDPLSPASVAYTDPEIAWVGLTENEVKGKGIKYGKGVFPWAASGRSLSLGRDEGITKVIFDESNERIIGCGAVRTLCRRSDRRGRTRN